MEETRAAAVDVAYYGREIRSSLGWLVLSLFFGGSGLAVYLTTPGAPVANLWVAAILGLPTLLLSLVELGKSRALILNPGTRRLRYLEGFFARRTLHEFSYDQVREVHLLSKKIPGGGGSRGSGAMEWWDLRIVLADQREILLQETSTDRACRLARHLGAAFGVQPTLNGQPLTVAFGPSNRLSPFQVVIHTAFLILAAVMLAVGIILAGLHYLKP